MQQCRHTVSEAGERVRDRDMAQVVSPATSAVRLQWGVGGWLERDGWCCCWRSAAMVHLICILVLDKACPVAGGVRDDAGRDCDGMEGGGILYVGSLIPPMRDGESVRRTVSPIR